MAEGKPILGESGVPSKQEQLKSDEIFEETIDIETIERQEMDKHHVLCDRCFIDGVLNVIAFCMCIVCGRYYCEKCFTGHNRSHTFIRSESKDGEREREIDEFVSYMMNDESDDESEKKFSEDDVCVCDYVDIKHELDEDMLYFISGLTGYKYKWWVVCSNSCIKVFSLSSNVLQRYIRLGSGPHDVTEIIVENKTTEQDSASCSEAVISGTDNKPNRKHLLAVTLDNERLILILDLDKSPAVIHNKIKTEEKCYSINSHDGNIYTVCGERSREPPPSSVYIMTVEGVTLKTFQTDFRSNSGLPYLTVLNGNIYMTDPDNHRVVCYNDEGRVLHQIKIDESWPDGICVDRSENKVYISSLWHHKVYELESDLNRYKSVIDQTTRYMTVPTTMCFYSDKLYVGHLSPSKWGSHVTVVRLL